MNYNFYFGITIFSLITALSCNAMEKPASTFKELTIIEHVNKAKYLSNDRIICLGKSECTIINPITNTKFIKISNLPDLKMTVHPCKDKVALYYDKTVTIHNTETGLKEWSETSDKRIYDTEFSLCSDDIKISFGRSFKIYNYWDNKIIDSYLLDIFFDQGEISKKLNGQLEKAFSSSYEKDFDSYWDIANPECPINYYSYYNKLIYILLFLQPSFEGQLSICYWDVMKKRCIHTLNVGSSKIEEIGNISIAPNKENLLIILENKCKILSVPDAVIKAKDGIEKVFTFRYFILTEYLLNNLQIDNSQISNQIAQHIIATLYKAYVA